MINKRQSQPFWLGFLILILSFCLFSTSSQANDLKLTCSVFSTEDTEDPFTLRIASRSFSETDSALRYCKEEIAIETQEPIKLKEPIALENMEDGDSDQDGIDLLLRGIDPENPAIIDGREVNLKDYPEACILNLRVPNIMLENLKIILNGPCEKAICPNEGQVTAYQKVEIQSADQGDLDKDGICEKYTRYDDSSDDYPQDDNCPKFANPDQKDTDGDSIGDECDNCPEDKNPFQENWNEDEDQEGDLCDDSDHDGIVDAEDNCVKYFNPSQKDWNFDGEGDRCDDSDGDKVIDSLDNCIEVKNILQKNSDGDAYGDKCDNCPKVTSFAQLDQDGDGHGDLCDTCPSIYNPNQLGLCQVQIKAPKPKIAPDLDLVAPEYEPKDPPNPQDPEEPEDPQEPNDPIPPQGPNDPQKPAAPANPSGSADPQTQNDSSVDGVQPYSDLLASSCSLLHNGVFSDPTSLLFFLGWIFLIKKLKMRNHP